MLCIRLSNKQGQTLYNAINLFIIFKFEHQLRMLEAKFKEDKLSLQQSHTNEIQKILDRKNNEIESLKTNFSKKKKDYEETIHNLEKKGILFY